MAMFVVKTMKQVRRLMISMTGLTVPAISLALNVLPSPAILLIPSGLAILSIEFAWARNLLRRVREKLSKKKSTEPAPDTNDKQGP